MAGLLVAQQVSADVESLLGCRRLPAGQERSDCLERESAQLERERAGTVAPAASVAAVGAPAAAGPLTDAQRAAGGSSRSIDPGIGVTGVEYVEGRPRFALANGERWQAREERRLTLHPGSDVATLERTPGGMVLHFNHSFFGLHVVPAP